MNNTRAEKDKINRVKVVLVEKEISQKEHLRQHNQKDQAVMRFTHKPGEVLEADYAGDKAGYVDITVLRAYLG